MRHDARFLLRAEWGAASASASLVLCGRCAHMKAHSHFNALCGHSSVTPNCAGAMRRPMECAQAAPRRPRDQLFKKTDAVRAWKAALSAGIPNPRLSIAPDGTITITPGPAPQESTADTPEGIIEQL